MTRFLDDSRLFLLAVPLMTLYQRFDASDLILRDYLALERTIMSNERTLLAYGRTGLALFAAGITGLHLLSGVVGNIISLLFAIGGAAIGIFGVLRFKAIKHRLDLATPDQSADVTAEHASVSAEEAEARHV